MDTLPSKRRRLLSTASIALSASSEQSIQDSIQITPNRASYLSPTKASLARFNPSLLPQLKSAGEGGKWPRGQSKFGSQDDVQSEGSGPFQGLNPMPLRPTTPTKSSGRIELTRASSASPKRRLPSFNAGNNALPRSKSSTPGRASLPAKLVPSSPASGPLHSLTQVVTTTDREAQYRARRQLEFELRAISLPRSEHEGASNSMPRLPMQINKEEPALPLTPTQLGLEEAPEPPRGLIYSSPLRKAAKRKGSGLEPSLKPRDTAPGVLKTAPTEVPRSNMRTTEDGEHESTDKRDEIKKGRELEELLHQFKGLQSDVGLLEYELLHPENLGQKEVNDLVSIVTSTNPAHLPTMRPDFANPISSRLALFLPFSRIIVSQKATTSTTQEPIPSHRPIELQSPVPYLCAFTPLTMTSIETFVPQTGTDTSPLKHIDIRLRSPQNVLQVELQLSVNPEAESVESLSLSHISSWANSELETWIQKHVSEGDLSTIGWACGRYWDMASLRVRCWYRCYKNFGDLLSPLVGPYGSAVSTNKTKVALSRRRNRFRNEGNSPVTAFFASNDGEDFGPEEHDAESSLSRSTLLLHIGRMSLLFSRSNVSLLISWRIEIDWAGEVGSAVSASASYPKSWRSADTRPLDNVGRLFDILVRKMGVYGALTVVVPLLFE